MQRNLFHLTPSGPVPFQQHSATSRQAAEAIESRTGTLRRAVLDWLVSQGEHGATDEQLIDALGISPSTARPRRVDLVASGQVVDSGRMRATRSGRKAVVWVVKT